jgi:hypothetical protein
MSNEINKDWSHWIREDDEYSVTNRLGAKIAKQTPAKFGGRTPVDQNPKTAPTTAQVADGARSYDKSNDPVNHRQTPAFPSQNGPSNPQSRFVDRWTKAGLEQSTRAAQSRQSGNYLNRKS